MAQNASLIAFAILALTACDNAPALDDEMTYVVEAFLFEGEPVDDVRLTLAAPTSEADPIETPINDAAVILGRGSESWTLTSAGDGFYEITGEGPAIAPGDVFDLEIQVDGTTLTSTTAVPRKPEDVTLSRSVFPFPEARQENADRIRQILLGEEGTVTASWDNSDGDFHFVAVRLPVQEEPDFILPEFILDRIAAFEQITEPTRAGSHLITFVDFKVFGDYQVTVYRVNEEYAALYNAREQDSRDLNEPATNIDGGVGVFSAFSAELKVLSVVRE